jgi:hypothetical protein
MNVHPRSVRLAAAFVVVVMAGCAPVPSASPPTSSSTPAPPSDTPTAAIPLELQANGAALPAGLYTHSGFLPTITVELDGSWQAVHLASTSFDLDYVPAGPDVAIAFVRPSSIYAGGNSIVDPTTPAAAVATLESNLGLHVVETSTSLMDGLEGSQVTVENGAGTTDWGVLLNRDQSVKLDQGRRLWIAFFDTPDGLLAIVVNGPIDHWDEALAAAEPVLESVTIGTSE